MLVQVFQHVPIPALMVLLGVGKQDHKAHSDHNASGDEVLHLALQSKLRVATRGHLTASDRITKSTG